MSKIKIFSLGGLNEIGKNMYVVEVDEDIFVFDAGLKYADDKMLGVDYIIPNYDYLKENQKRIKGIFITHGHNEQMGALPDILPDLKDVNVYGAAFTIEIIKRDLLEEKLPINHLIEIKPHRKIDFGACSVFPIRLTHSVPDALGYVLYTPDGACFYTGNFVIDPTVSGNYKTDIGKLAYVGKQGVLVLMSESRYAQNQGYTSPHHRMRSAIRENLNRYDGRILFNIFQTQLYRIEELLEEVKQTNRKIIIMGKQLEALIEQSIDKHYIQFDKARIGSIFDASDPNAVIIISDEREKPFSNINRIIRGYDKFIQLTEEDTVIFASPVYPGTEKSATKVFDDIARIGSNLVVLPAEKYLSLHASSEDLLLMIDLMKPKYYFPVNGEYSHQVHNAKVALQSGIKEENILLKTNGQVVTFIDGKLVDNGEVMPVDDILIDGKTAGDVGELVLKDREVLSENGVVIVSITLDKKTKAILAGPEIYTRGFIFVKENIDLIKEAEKKAMEIVLENTKENYVEFNKVKTLIRDALGKYFYQETECKPMILLVIQEV